MVYAAAGGWIALSPFAGAVGTGAGEGVFEGRCEAALSFSFEGGSSPGGDTGEARSSELEKDNQVCDFE